VKTISTYRSRILEKMNMVSNADITTYALRNQLIQ
jgi:two-component system, NarL family, invasion response regulator UvrY